jgi:hypothetical protein
MRNKNAIAWEVFLNYLFTVRSFFCQIGLRSRMLSIRQFVQAKLACALASQGTSERRVEESQEITLTLVIQRRKQTLLFYERLLVLVGPNRASAVRSVRTEDGTCAILSSG